MTEPWYNFTNFTSKNAFVDILKFANQVTKDWFGALVIFGFMFVLLISFKSQGYELRSSITSSALISTIIAILMRAIGLVSDYVIYILVVISIIGIISLYYGE